MPIEHIPHIVRHIAKNNAAWEPLILPATCNPTAFWIGAQEEGLSHAPLVVYIRDTKSATHALQLIAKPVFVNGQTCTVTLFKCCPEARHCQKCYKWGHSTSQCHSHVHICAKCGEAHNAKYHNVLASCCRKDPVGKVNGECTHLPRCINCRGNHLATSQECGFYIH